MVRARRPGRHLRNRIGLAALLVMAAFVGCASSGGGRAGLGPGMENAAVLESILEPVLAGGDFQPLFDRLADDVVLELTISGDSRPPRELRGKRKVMGFFLDENAVEGFGQGGPLEYSGTGDRVVVEGVTTFVRRSGTTVRARESAVVVDFVNGRIVRFLVIQEAVPALSATRKVRPLKPRSNPEGHEIER